MFESIECVGDVMFSGSEEEVDDTSSNSVRVIYIPFHPNTMERW